MRVFISHQKDDSNLAADISVYLKTHHKIDCYLDLIDPNASKAGDELGDYLRDVMSKCTQLMAVVSEKTKGSWWVPWEIGIATEKDYPIATFSGDNTILPEYLRKWPYLKTKNDLDIYAKASQAAMNQYSLRKSQYIAESSARHSSTQEFYRSIRASLRQ